MPASILRRAGALLAVLALLPAAACAAGSYEAGPRNTLSIGFTAEPANLDFTTTEGVAIPEVMLTNVYEGLVELGASGEIEPLLAKSWTVSEDRTVYDFTLHDDVVFSNGEPFTAEDVEFSIERVPTEWTLALKSSMDVVDDVEVLSPTEVRVRLKRPSNKWLFDMTTRVGAVFSREGVADLANDPVGTGPFELAEWVRGESITLRARDDYWGEAPPLDGVVFRYFNDALALNNALLTEQIDVISSVQAPETIEQFTSEERFRLIEGTTNGEVVLALNNSRAPLDDVRVRRAVNHAVDREALLDTVWAGHGTLIGSMVPPTDPWYQGLSGYEHDPQRARELLAEAGQEDLALEFRVPNLPYAVASAQVIQSQLRQVGITAEIDVLEFPARWLEEVFTGQDYDMSVIQHTEPRDIVTFGDPDYYWRYDSPELRDLLAEADRGSEEQQVAAMREAARLLHDDAAAVFLYLQPNLILAHEDVLGLPENRITESFDVTELSWARS
ncbi:peptide/nickel transport system substrate-binding protein [Spinactinospora alkalitolerans]|uniref:Peptide/nickel transport system substrate-binding protein n=1 Tax=Spinactinospora alkalitolerans TaxID=687207 RepID=A0A852TSL3_9ACTN|nr:ABC transporter substrate-binding protein [Spinactinospora alkalitolerans]NYE46928.1 peptide/nickel transport system substrate-binding protein [Spinactinospora alkalitolerans]